MNYSIMKRTKLKFSVVWCVSLTLSKLYSLPLFCLVISSNLYWILPPPGCLCQAIMKISVNFNHQMLQTFTTQLFYSWNSGFLSPPRLMIYTVKLNWRNAYFTLKHFRLVNLSSKLNVNLCFMRNVCEHSVDYLIKLCQFSYSHKTFDVLCFVQIHRDHHTYLYKKGRQTNFKTLVDLHRLYSV